MRPSRSSLLAAVSLVVCLLVGAADASSAVRTAHSGWSWGSPRPQGEDLDAIAFAGQTGYAAGAFGTLLKTTDGGLTWTALASGLRGGLSNVKVLGPNTVIVSGTCALRRSDDGGATFRRLPWTASDEQCFGGIQAVDFPDAATGMLLLRDGTVFRSTDGGRTWARRTSVPGTRAATTTDPVAPTDLDFTSATTGVAATVGGDIFRTVDGGSTWRAVLAEPFAISNVTFASATVGYAVGDAPVALRTDDGGASWTQQPLPADVPGLRRVACATPDACAGVTPARDRLAVTTNGGASWDSVSPTSFGINDVGLPSATQITAVGVGGDTVVSSDAGATFTSIDVGLFEGLFTGVRAVGQQFGVAFGRFGVLARTTDGGETWTQSDAATAEDIRDASFVNAGNGFVLDRSGQLLRTDNGGQSWEILDTGTAQRPEAVRALTTQRVLLVGPAGVRRSTDGGRTFRANTQRRVRTTPLFGAERSGSTLVAYGPRALLLSRDGGTSFRRLRLPGRRTRIDDLDVAGRRTLVLLDAQGRLWRSDTLGRRWRPLHGVGSEVAFAVDFADARRGWLAATEFGDARAGWVLRTGDGGRTWTPQLISRTRLPREGLSVSGPSTGLAVAGGFFATRNAGRLGRASRLRISTPTRRVRRAGNAVRIRGRLSRARGGERVVVSTLERGATRWRFQDAVAASDGRFTVVARTRRGMRVVAQWSGDGRLDGDGTGVLRVGGPR